MHRLGVEIVRNVYNPRIHPVTFFNIRTVKYQDKFEAVQEAIAIKVREVPNRMEGLNRELCVTQKLDKKKNISESKGTCIWCDHMLINGTRALLH